MPATLSVTRRVLSILRVLNWAYGGAILALLIASFIQPEWFFRAIGVKETSDFARIGRALQMVAMLGIAAIPLYGVILDRLIAMVDTVRAGDPFVIDNAERLKTIAWSVLGLEAIHIVILAIVRMARTVQQPLDIGGRLTLAPAITVLLLFVLAKVFEQGARMRADLEGTV